MSSTVKIEQTVNGYYAGTNDIAINAYTGQPMTDYRMDDGNHPFSTLTPVGNGIFLSGSHSFDNYGINKNNQLIEFKTISSTINNTKVDSVTDLRGWDPHVALSEYPSHSHLNDLSVVASKASVADSDINPFMIFDTTNDASRILSNKNLTFYGQASTGNANIGLFTGASVEGQFDTDIITKRGDSGGVVVAHASSDGSGPDYNVGILSLETEEASTFSYLRPQEFYNIIHQAEQGSGNNFSNMAPDLIFSDRVGGYLRGSGRRADIITHGNDATIVVENGGDLINSGSGTNTVVAVAPSAQGSAAGTTFVVSPGDEVISGAGKNDRLVALADRLWTNEHGIPTLNTLSNTSETIQVNGGIGHDYGDKAYATYSSHFNYSGSEVSSHDSYVIYYYLQHGEAGDTLRINFRANDQTSPLTDFGYKALWSSSITVQNFHDGDLGIHLTYDNSWGDNGTDAYIASYASAAKNYVSTKFASNVVNDDIADNWNGVLSSSIYGDVNLGQAADRIQQNALQYGGMPQQGQTLVGTDSGNILTGSLGDDVLRGGAGNDTLIGRSGDDILIGGAGDDQLDGGPGNDVLVGGAGDDTAIISGLSTDYPLTFRVTATGIAEFVVAPLGSNAGSGEHLRSVEHVKFSDTTVDLVLPHNVADFGSIVSDIGSAAGRVYSLYEGLFGRAPTPLELEQHTAEVPSTLWLQGVIGKVMVTSEYQNAAGTLGNTDFTEYLYEHMLHRTGDSGGLAYYSGRLDQGESRAEIIEEFTYSPEHQALLHDTFDAGIFLVDRNAADVARLYYTTFDRAPDEGGLRYFTSRVAGGESVADIANLLISSGEGQGNFSQLSNSQFIDAIILRSDGRHATSTEISTYDNQLQSWQTRADLLYHTATSAEAQQWHAAHIESGWVVT